MDFFDYKINESQRWNVQHGEYVNYIVIYLLTDHNQTHSNHFVIYRN